MKSTFIILFVAILSVGCMEFNQNEVKYDHEIIGAWSNVQWSESGISMDRVKNLQANTFGYLFNSNGTMVARHNAGWCGTPPIVTADYDGTWRVEDGKIILRFGYWGGDTTQDWLISGSSGKQVTINIINSEYHSRD